jgi:Ras-related protein Rab-1A
MISTYYRGAHAIIIVYDVSNMNSFYSINNWLREIKNFAPDNCLKYLVCNKIDKIDKITSESKDTNTFSWVVNDEVN